MADPSWDQVRVLYKDCKLPIREVWIALHELTSYAAARVALQSP